MMKTLTLILMMLMFALSGAAQAETISLYGEQVLDVNDDTYSYITSWDTTTVNVYEEAVIGTLLTRGESVANIYGGSITTLFFRDTSTVNMYGGSIYKDSWPVYVGPTHASTMNMYGGSITADSADSCFHLGTALTLNMYGGSILGIRTDNTAEIYMSGGQIGRIESRSNSSVFVSGGQISDRLRAIGSSSMTVSGGEVPTIRAENTSAITLLGYSFELGTGLSWDTDGETILGTGTITGKWFDEGNTSFSMNIHTNDETATIKAPVYWPDEISSTPFPEDNAIGVAWDVVLSWAAPVDPNVTPPYAAPEYNVHLGTDAEALPMVSQRQAGTTYTPSENLNDDTVYYWRVDVVDPGVGTVTPGVTWSFRTEPAYPRAILVSPEDGETEVPVDAVLEWASDPMFDSHRVYFSSIEDDVTARDAAALVADQTETVYNPFGPTINMAHNTEYFWAIDEVLGGNVVVAGDIWSFTTYDPGCDIDASYGDLTGDCLVTLEDFAILAGNWLLCGYEDQDACP